jgi:hypothetical protein
MIVTASVSVEPRRYATFAAAGGDLDQPLVVRVRSYHARRSSLELPGATRYARIHRPDAGKCLSSEPTQTEGGM